MSEIILYPTETIYGLGVNPLEAETYEALLELKGREKTKVASWLVRDHDDLERYGVLSPVARSIAEAFLPGELTLIVPATDEVPDYARQDETIGLRISSDPLAQSLVETYMAEHGAPLTCTSANVSGAPTFPTPEEILQQFGEKAYMITKVIDDGLRKGLASTVVRVVGDEVKVLREGAITEDDIQAVLR